MESWPSPLEESLLWAMFAKGVARNSGGTAASPLFPSLFINSAVHHKATWINIPDHFLIKRKMLIRLIRNTIFKEKKQHYNTKNELKPTVRVLGLKQHRND